MPQPPFDDDQKTAVNVRSNTVVAAGAGSGKTTVLAGRYLALVQEGVEIPSILTLTFTRKAAAEMYSRIHKLLVENSDNPAVRKQLPLFDQAQISTLDSFCARIARNDAVRFGLPSSFSIDQTRLSSNAESYALDFILRHNGNSALHQLIQANGFDSVWKNLFAAYAEYHLLITGVPDHAGAFEKQQRHCLNEIRTLFTQLDGLYQQMGRIAAGAAKKSATLDKAAAAADGWPDTEELIEEESWEALNSLTQSAPYRKPRSDSTNPDLILLKDIHEQLTPLAEKAQGYLVMLMQKELFAGVMELLDTFATGWLSIKRQQGMVSFSDVVAMAVTLLRENLELRKFYKEQFRYIMIDEFQDNNEEQKELLYLLAEKSDRLKEGIPAPSELDPGKLFFVGDEKQSIYRFRGADVRVFKQLAADLGNTPVELATNYRSNPLLIDFFNSFFPAVFTPEEGGESNDFEAEFRPLKGREKQPGVPEPEIRLHILEASEIPEEDELQAAESEAYEAARIITEAVAGRGLNICDRDGTIRPPAYDDFALLLRTTGNQIIYERIFRRFEIPYTTENIRTLFYEAPANDIYAALQLALYPEDRTAYAVFLRSFFVNLEDEYLLKDLLENRGLFSLTELDLPGDEYKKYCSGREIYRTLQDMMDTVPHRQLLRYLWFDCGYRYNLLKNPAYHGYLEFYDYLVTLADASWNRGESAAVFIDFLRDNMGEYKKLDEIETLSSGGGGIRIMTIHKSKGLEFPIVLTGSTGQGSTNMDGRAPYYIDSEFGLTINLSRTDEQGKKSRKNPFYEKSRAAADLQETAELKRLLYVAFTRAEQHLIMLGYEPGKKGKIPSLLDLIRKGLGTEDSPRIVPFTPATLSMLKKRGSRKRNRTAGNYLGFLGTEDFAMPSGKDAVSATRLNAAAAQSLDHKESISLPKLAVDNLIQEGAERFGTMVHRALELLTLGEDPSALPNLFPEHSSENQQRISHMAGSIAADFWESPERKALIPDGTQVYAEKPFTLGLKTGSAIRAVDGIIDLYCLLDDKIICLDFKTNRAVTPGEYDMQMYLYRKALTAIHGKPVKTYLIYLRDNIARESTADFSRESIENIFQLLDSPESLN